MRRSVYFSTGFLLFIALVLLWIPWLGETLFYSKGEPREAIVAVSMIQSGDWILPVSCGSDIPYKPPFLAWLIAGLAMLFNGGEVNEFISRLPSAIAAIALVLGGYGWARRIRGERFALYMAVILATSVEFYRAAIACRVDMVLTACMVGAMYVLFQVLEHRGRDNFGRYLLATLLLTCAVLTKGPVGALLPCLVIGLYFLFRGERFFPTLGRMAALCVASFIVPAVWYYYAWLSGGPEFLQLVWEENFQRLAGSMPYESHVKPFWYNFVTLIIGMLPWTLLAAMSLSAAKRLVSQPFKPAGMLAVTAIVVITVFYCIPASKRSVYLLPVYPFLAYGVASIAETLVETRVNLAYTRTLAIIAIAAPVIIVATRFWPLADFVYEPVGWWSYIFLALPAVLAIGWLMQAHPRGAIGGACLISWGLMLAFGASLAPAIFNPLSDKPEARMLDALAGDKPIYVVGADKHTSNAFAINYYMNDRVRRLPSAADADTCPTGTVLIFSQRADTVGLPSTYHMTLLKPRLSDTRKPALFAVQTGAPVVRRKIYLEGDSVGKDLPPTPEGLPPQAAEIPVMHNPVKPKAQTAPADTARRIVVKRIERDTVSSPRTIVPVRVNPEIVPEIAE